jgi:hypothetical protein
MKKVNKLNKQNLFEMMHKVGGMPLNENEFNPTATFSDKMSTAHDRYSQNEIVDDFLSQLHQLVDYLENDMYNYKNNNQPIPPSLTKLRSATQNYISIIRDYWGVGEY